MSSVLRVCISPPGEIFSSSCCTLRGRVLSAELQKCCRKSYREIVVSVRILPIHVKYLSVTGNAISHFCRIMIASLRFLLGYDQQKDDEEGDESDSDAEEECGKPGVAVNREAIYKVHNHSCSLWDTASAGLSLRVLPSVCKICHDRQCICRCVIECRGNYVCFLTCSFFNTSGIPQGYCSK